MIKLLFFARLREQLGREMLQLEASPELSNIAAIIELLRQRGGVWAEQFDTDQTVLVALNQEMATPDTLVKDGDEVAFFPPVTGG
jgi:sulfur-carrier protein